MELNQDKIAIIVAPNGARKTQRDHPSLPITVTEIVQDVRTCRDAGAAMVHLHARDFEGRHSLAIDDNIKLQQAVKEEMGDSIIIQLTTEAIGIYSPTQQMELIRHTRPEAASFALKELIPDNSHITKAQRFFQWVADSGMIAQYILYSYEDVQRYFELLRSEIIPTKNHHILLVLGRYNKAQQSHPRELLPMLTPELLCHRNRWSVCAFGVNEQKCLISAMLLGADIRVGFENNHLNNRGLIAKNNAQQVDNIKELTDLLGINRHNAASFRSALTH